MCELFAGYSKPMSNSTTTSGVVYRTGIQDPVWAEIKGFNYVPPSAVNDIDMWRDYDRPMVERDMAIARRTGFNFARVFLNYHVWDAQRGVFLQNLKHFVATAHANGISTMPIPWDLCWFGCRDENISINSSGKCWYASPQYSLADNRTFWLNEGQAYVEALVSDKGLSAGTPGLLLWDVVNEPESGGNSGLPGETGPRWQFVKHMVSLFRQKTSTPTTVGVARVTSLGEIGADVDILSFHSYHPNWETGLERTETALQFSRQLQVLTATHFRLTINA
jgi:hypothetical protein